MVRSNHLFVVFALVERKNDKRENASTALPKAQTANCISPRNIKEHE